MPPTIALVITPAAQAEGGSGTTAYAWTATLTRNGSTTAIPYAWSVAGNGANPADATDFGGAFPNGSGSFATGETIKTGTILVAGDQTVELDESFLMTFVVTGVGTATANGTILNDDIAVMLKEMVAVAGARDNTLSMGNLSTTKNAWKQRSYHKLAYDVDSKGIRVQLPRFRVNFVAPYDEKEIDYNLTFPKMAIECNGVTVPVLWSGARSVVIAAGSAATTGVPYISSDYLLPSAFGLSAFTRDMVLYLRMRGVCDATSGSVRVPAGQPMAGSVSSSVRSFDPTDATVIDDTDATGAIDATGTTLVGPQMGFAAWIMGTPAAAGAMSGYSVGDSNLYGASDNWVTADGPKIGFGFSDWAQTDGNGAGVYAMTNGGRSTSTLKQYRASSAYRKVRYKFFNVVMVQHGTNDFTSSGDGVTAAEHEANVAAVIADAKNAGVQRALVCTVPPNNVSNANTANWNSPSGPPAVFNARARSVSISGQDGVIDVRYAVTTDSDRYTYASDLGDGGLHMTKAGHLAIKPYARNAMLALTIDGVAPGTVTVPVNTALPVITGTAQVGQTLTVTPGTYTNSPTARTYQLYRDGVAISGANATTYAVVSADAGAAIYVVETASNASGAGSPARSASVGPVVAAGTPASTAAPALSGSPVVGQTITWTLGSFSNTPTGYVSQVIGDGVVLATVNGSTGLSYTIASGDASINNLYVSVVASNANGNGAAVASNSIGPVTAATPAAPTFTAAPVITGTPQVGQTLTVSNGATTGSPAPSITYQWNRAGAAIGGATGKTYQPVAADVGSPITCTDTASNGVSPNATSTSAATAAVTAAPAGTPFLNATFTDTDGTLLPAYTSDSGAHWSRHPTSTTGANDNFVINGGQLTINATGILTISDAAPPSNGNYKVTGDYVVPSGGPSNSRVLALCGRVSPTARTYYAAQRMDATNLNRWRLVKVVDGTGSTTLGDGPSGTALTAGQTGTVELLMNGSTISMVVDGITLVSVTDTAIPATSPGVVGINNTGTISTTGGTTFTAVRATAL